MTTNNQATPEPRPFTEQAFNQAGGHEVPPRPSLRDAIVTAAEMLALPIPPRVKILGQWAREGDLGYVYAPRGHGKTWMTLLIANAIATGIGLGAWVEGEEARDVFCFDAEMNLADLQERARVLGISSPKFHWLQNEIVAQQQKRRVNITDLSDQKEISEFLRDGAVFVIDNLSTAASGMAENDNDAFDQIKDWLLDLRSRGITVIIVHHAGRNGEMRGASRREDMAHWIISLKNDSQDGQPTSWITEFKKCRNCQANDAPPLRWTIQIANGTLTYTSKLHSGPDAMLSMIQDGIHSAKELSVELNVTPGCVSKWAKKLADAKRIEIRDRKYFPVD